MLVKTFPFSKSFTNKGATYKLMWRISPSVLLKMEVNNYKIIQKWIMNLSGFPLHIDANIYS